MTPAESLVFLARLMREGWKVDLFQTKTACVACHRPSLDSMFVSGKDLATALDELKKRFPGA